jgi:CHAD domain-containing protein
MEPDGRISRSASIEDELRRIARAGIDTALAWTGTAAGRPARAVHQCRKTIKRLRALLCLGRREAGDAARRIDRGLRDAGRLLAEARDAHVIQRTAATLCSRDAEAESIEIAARSDAASPDPAVMREVAEGLTAVGAELDAYLADGAPTRQSLGAAVDRACSRAARRMDRFRERKTRRRAHDWRKGVQRYANQIDLMADLMPERAVELDALDRLAKCLGEYNDLGTLRSALSAGQLVADAESRTLLARLARARQRILSRRALELGDSVFRAQTRPVPTARAEPGNAPRRWL